MIHLDFSNTLNKTIKKLSVIFMSDSFFYAVIDEHNRIIHHQTFENIIYSEPETIQKITESMSCFRNIECMNALSMNDYSLQSNVRDDKIIEILPSTQNKINFIEIIPGQNLYNYFQLNPAQDKLLETLTQNIDYKVRDLVSLLSLYHLVHRENVLHIHVANKRVYIYAQSNGQLLFYRGFEFQQKEDILYFAIAAKNLFSIDDYTTFVSGHIIENSPIYTLLSQYTKNIKIANNETIEVMKPNYNQNDSHYYFMHIGSIL